MKGKKNTIRVTVSKEDIKAGKRRHLTGCPVALALQKIGFSKASVGREQVTMGDYYALLPRSVKSFIYNFDEKLPVKPFRFQLTTRLGSRTRED